MLVNSIIDNIYKNQIWSSYNHDYIYVEWYELDKKIMRKTTSLGKDIGINITTDTKVLQHGDILAIQDKDIIVLQVTPCKTIAITPKNNYQLAKACYEIGNRHAPLFFDEQNHGTLLVEYNQAMYTMLEKLELTIKILEARLINRISNNSHQSHHEH